MRRRKHASSYRRDALTVQRAVDLGLARAKAHTRLNVAAEDARSTADKAERAATRSRNLSDTLAADADALAPTQRRADAAATALEATAARRRLHADTLESNLP